MMVGVGAFFGIFLALEVSRFERESTLPPQAGTLYRVLRKREPLDGSLMDGKND